MADIKNSVPILRTPNDPMRLGNASVKSDITPLHPVQIIQDQHEKKIEESKKAMLAHIYGIHVPLKLQMQETILSQFQRLSGLKSSFAGLETLLQKDTTIDYCDYLGNPDYSDFNSKPDVHTQMEQRLGDKPIAFS
eukprot:TRINITY_DN12118_c0_g1_i1.p1 TRINITY_DN12118_c0_g1~~TRINITY_DN12118_c0_g1_i1.p1  ORF type:complete len:136 (+),score=30.24 TRINITY_DN12118_c0_g1_i1:51-458(+)